MTTPRVTKIGLVAHYSPQGDWAFDAALQMARTRQATLNVFQFLESPYEAPLDLPPSQVSTREFDDKILIDADRRLREYYDDSLGEFVDVGFRVCESGRHNLELRQCLKRREFELLIVPYLEYGSTFGNMPVEEFAYRFNAPVMLVGPELAQQYHLNPSAEVISKTLYLPEGILSVIPQPKEFQHLSVI